MNIHKEIKDLRAKTLGEIEAAFYEKEQGYELVLEVPVKGWIDGHEHKVTSLTSDEAEDASGVTRFLSVESEYDAGGDESVQIEHRTTDLGDLDLEVLLRIRDAVK